jgi:hypothetical protein
MSQAFKSREAAEAYIAERPFPARLYIVSEKVA